MIREYKGVSFSHLNMELIILQVLFPPSCGSRGAISGYHLKKRESESCHSHSLTLSDVSTVSAAPPASSAINTVYSSVTPLLDFFCFLSSYLSD